MQARFKFITILLALYVTSCDNSKHERVRAQSDTIEKVNESISQSSKKILEPRKMKLSKYYMDLQEELNLSDEEIIKIREVTKRYTDERKKLAKEGKWSGKNSNTIRSRWSDSRDEEYIEIMGKTKSDLKRNFDKSNRKL